MPNGYAPRIYNIATETATGVLNSETLKEEVAAASGLSSALVRIRSGDGILELYGTSPWTNRAEIDALDVVVLAHTGTPKDPPREASSVTVTQTTATSDVLMEGMSLTPGAGSYYVRFSTSIENSKSNAKTYVSVYAAGVQIPHTQRHSRRGGGQGDVQDIIATHTLIQNLGESEAIEIHWRVSTGTAIAHERTFLLQDA